jgi:PAS domain S-box-containing protein
MMGNRRRVLLVISLALYSVLVFIADVISPLGIEVWVLNVPVILLPVFFRSPRMVVLSTLACAAMVALGSAFSPPGGNPPFWDFLNRGMGIATMGLIAGLAINIIQRSAQLNHAISSLRCEIAEHRQTSRTLAESETRLRLAVEGAGMGTFDVDLQTGKVVWSATHLRMLGYEVMAERETTIEMWRSCVHPDDLQRVLEAREQALRHHSVYSVEYRIQRADSGETVWLAVFGHYHHAESGEAVRFLGVSFDITRRKELEREVLEIAAREQRHIGQELHDGVGQELTGLGLMAQSLAQCLPEAAAEKGIALRLITGLDGVRQNIRELSRGLVPVHLESRGLSAALEDLAARTTRASGISVTADCPEWVELPDHWTATQLFRITQEAVNNALRHGRPRLIRLALLTEPNGLRLRISDDGIGIRDEPVRGSGLGLRIMQYRAGLIGGVLHIGPSEGGGTAVTCTLPRSNANVRKEPGSQPGQDESLDRG